MKHTLTPLTILLADRTYKLHFPAGAEYAKGG